MIFLKGLLVYQRFLSPKRSLRPLKDVYSYFLQEIQNFKNEDNSTGVTEYAAKRED